jgi:hypothetical protein
VGTSGLSGIFLEFASFNSKIELCVQKRPNLRIVIYLGAWQMLVTHGDRFTSWVMSLKPPRKSHVWGHEAVEPAISADTRRRLRRVQG